LSRSPNLVQRDEKKKKKGACQIKKKKSKKTKKNGIGRTRRGAEAVTWGLDEGSREGSRLRRHSKDKRSCSKFLVGSKESSRRGSARFPKTGRPKKLPKAFHKSVLWVGANGLDRKKEKS